MGITTGKIYERQSQRLTDLMKLKHIKTKTELARFIVNPKRPGDADIDKVNSKKSQFSQIKKRGMTNDLIEDISYAFPEIRRQWLTGEDDYPTAGDVARHLIETAHNQANCEIKKHYALGEAALAFHGYYITNYSEYITLIAPNGEEKKMTHSDFDLMVASLAGSVEAFVKRI